MEWIKPIIISLIIIACVISTLVILCNRYRANIYKLGDVKSKKLEDREDILNIDKIFICNNCLDRNYISQKL